MKLKVLTVLIDGGTFQLVRGGFDPALASLLQCDALARSHMSARLHIDLHLGVTCVGVFLAVESLDVAFAELVGVIHNPRLALLALPSRPSSLSDRHDPLLHSVGNVTMLHYVAIRSAS